MSLPEKSRDMVRLLRERILSGYYAGGSRLPSIRSLMREFSLSNGSVKKGIDYLVDEGLVETVHGSGIFVRRHPRKFSCSDSRIARRIALFGAGTLYRPGHGIYAAVQVGVMRAAAAANCQLQMNPLPEHGLTVDYVDTQAHDTDGVIFLHEIDYCLEELSLAHPAVGVCVQRPLSDNLSLVNLDPFSSARQAVDYFISQAVDEVTVVSPPHPAYCHRGDEFISLWRDSGRSIRAVVSYHGENGAEYFAADCGYLFTTCSTMQACLGDFVKRHGRLPRNTLLGLDGKNFMEPDFYRAPAIILDWELAGEAAFCELLRRLEQPGSAPRRIYLSGQLKLE